MITKEKNIVDKRKKMNDSDDLFEIERELDQSARQYKNHLLRARTAVATPKETLYLQNKTSDDEAL